MNRLFIVFAQEYMLKVKTRGFVIGTILTPLLLAAIFVVPTFFLSMNTQRESSLVIADESGVLLPQLERALADTTSDPADSAARSDSDHRPDRSGLTILSEPINGRSTEQLQNDLNRRVSEEQVDAFLFVPKDVLEGGECRYYARNVSDFRRNSRIERAIERAVREVRIASSNLDPEQIRRLLLQPKFSTFKVAESGKASEDEGRTFMLAYLLGFLSYIMLASYSAHMLRVVLEEKTSRSAEVIISVVRPSELVGGKILATAAVALTQMSVWAIFSVAITTQFGGSGGIAGQIIQAISDSGINASMLLLSGLYFLLGFLFYATIFGAVGALISSEEEAQQVQFPVMIPLIGSSLLMLLAIRDPDSPIIAVCSFIPFFTPILMTVRLCVLPPAPWQIAVTCLVMVLSIAAVTWIAGRIFRVGLLMYGKRPNLPELIKWIRQR